MACRDVWNIWHEGLQAPQNPTAKPEGFVATGGPRAMYFTHHGKPWLKSIIARRDITKYVLSLLKCYLPCEKNNSFTQRWPGRKSVCWLFPYCAHPPRLTARTDNFQTTVSFLTAKNIYSVHSAIQHFYNTSLYICTLYYLAIWRRQDHWRKPAWGIVGTEYEHIVRVQV